MLIRKPFEVVAGDTWSRMLTITRGGQPAGDISGYTVILTGKHSREDPDADAIFQHVVKDHIDAPGSRTEIALTSADTQAIYDSPGHDCHVGIRVITPEGNVKTTHEGTVEATLGTTHRTTH